MRVNSKISKQSHIAAIPQHRRDKKPTVFLFLSLRSYISDALHTSYICHLADAYRVVVFVREQVGMGDPAREYYQHPDITYIKTTEPPSRFWMLFSYYLRTELLRRYNNTAIVWRQRRVGNRRRLLVRFFARLLPKRLISPNFLFMVERRFVPGYTIFKEYVVCYNPSLVLTANPGLTAFDAWAILCASRAKIPSVSMDFSWDNLTSLPRLVRAPDYLICWDEFERQCAIEIHGFAPEQVFVTGVLRYDHHFIDSPLEVDRETFLKQKGLDPTLRTIFFSPRQYGSSTFPTDFIEAFLGWQKTNALPEKLNLFVRMHPLDSWKPLQKFVGYPNVHVEGGGKKLQEDGVGGLKVEMNERDIINTKMTVKYTDVCVNITSAMSIEAIIWGKPVVNIGFIPGYEEYPYFPHYRPLIDLGAVRLAMNMEQVREFIAAYLHNPSLDAEGRKKVLELVVEPTDGNSAKRSVECIGTILARESA